MTIKIDKDFFMSSFAGRTKKEILEKYNTESSHDAINKDNIRITMLKKSRRFLAEHFYGKGTYEAQIYLDAEHDYSNGKEYSETNEEIKNLEKMTDYIAQALEDGKIFLGDGTEFVEVSENIPKRTKKEEEEP